MAAGFPGYLIPIVEPAVSNLHHRTRTLMTYRLLVLSLLWPLGAFAQTAQVDPMTLRARDTHQNLTIAADPYTSADRYTREVFGKTSPYVGGVVAVEVYFRNDNDSPIRVNLETIQLMISVPRQDREKLLPLTAEEVADRAILRAQANPHAPRLPFPHSGSASGKGKAWDEMHSAIRSIILSADVLPPHTTTHGFLFFDVDHQFDALRYSSVYVPDLFFMTDKKALLFFEIDLRPASSSN